MTKAGEDILFEAIRKHRHDSIEAYKNNDDVKSVEADMDLYEEIGEINCQIIHNILLTLREQAGDCPTGCIGDEDCYSDECKDIYTQLTCWNDFCIDRAKARAQ